MSASRKKKSRFSGKNKPKRVRLTCRSSTSVAEKSVLKVNEPFSDGVSLYTKSNDGSKSELLAAPVVPFSNTLLRRTLPDGTTSSPTPWFKFAKPIARPDALGLYCRLRDTHALFSFLRTTPREKFKPQVSVLGSNDSDLNGIAISAIHPPSNRPACA
jgi:hypothetical protein